MLHVYVEGVCRIFSVGQYIANSEDIVNDTNSL